MKALSFVLLLAIAVSQSVNAQGVGDAAPDFTVDLADGGTFTLSEQLGKVVLIYFFGNACPLCETSGPLVQGLYETYMDETDFVAIGLDTWDNSSTVESVTQFGTDAGITFPLALEANFVKLAYNWSHDKIVVVDKEGVIQRKANTSASNDIESSSMVIQAALEGTTVGLDRIEEEQRASIYPMPASELLHVDFYLEDEADVQLIISDITGKERKRMKYLLGSGQQKLSLNIDDMEQGVYFYSMRINNSIDAGKLIVQ